MSITKSAGPKAQNRAEGPSVILKEGDEYDDFTSIGGIHFLPQLRHFCNNKECQLKNAGPKAQNRAEGPSVILKDGDEYDDFTSIWVIQLLPPTTLLLQQRGMSIKKSAGPKAQNRAGGPSMILKEGDEYDDFTMQHIIPFLFQLQHFCNNKECQSKKVLGRRPRIGPRARP